MIKLIFANDLNSSLIADLGVTQREIEECFLNRNSLFEQSISPGEEILFVAKTDRRRALKIKFNIKEKLQHVLQLPDRTVTIDQDGMFCEVTSVETIVEEN